MGALNTAWALTTMQLVIHYTLYTVAYEHQYVVDNRPLLAITLIFVIMLPHAICMHMHPHIYSCMKS